ncbi:MAG TPA: PelD GGDEF domain-containing protein [Noviherbaspirillum sp.]|jgi:hypothetical protein|uniref:PelD GGDEF domain-containing protein n=1 Tax=Noviherbaspirillum sp. TaxID=1926288 RepID=UPI002F94702F
MPTSLPDLLRLPTLLRRRAPGPAAPGEEASLAARWAWVAVETLAGNALSLAFMYWVAPADPFGLDAAFPWIWIMPTLLAMRYGTAVGVASVLLLVMAWAWHASLAGSGHILDLFPKEFFLGGLLLNLVAGQFSDVWSARTRRLRAVNAYLDERLNTLTKNHFLLRLSHERLEQDLLAKPLTLRETLLRLRDLSRRQDGGGTLPGAQEFMQLLAQSCQLETASLHAVVQGRPDAVAAAVLGEARPLDADDPLLRYCLEQNTLVHVQTEALAADARDASRYLVCAPVLSSDGRLAGLIAVERMPFFALNNDLLKLLAVLAGYYADGLTMHAAAAQVLDRLPHCPPELALDVVRLHRIREQAGIESTLVALVFGTDGNARDMFEQVRRFKRGVDLAWELKAGERRTLITLLPLAGPAAVEGYLIRVETALAAQFGGGFLDNHIATHTARIGKLPPVDTLADLVGRCGG